MVFKHDFLKGEYKMRKSKLMLSTLAILSCMPLTSCGVERTNSYEGTLEMYKAFFEKTYEYDNMKVVINLEDGGFRTEYIRASTSHTIDSNTDLDTWAFLNEDGWKTVAYEYNFESPTSKTHWFKYDASSYEEEFKNYIGYIDFTKSFEKVLEIDPSFKDEIAFEAKKENLGDGKAHFEVKATNLVKEDGQERWMTFSADSEDGLVSRVDISTFDSDDGEKFRRINFEYACVKPIDIPDITGWEKR